MATKTGSGEPGCLIESANYENRLEHLAVLTVPFGAIQSAGPLRARHVLENEFGRSVSNVMVTVP